jgi:hypothetical protein
MTDDEREHMREVLIFEYHENNQIVLSLPDDELREAYEEAITWIPHFS